MLLTPCGLFVNCVFVMFRLLNWTWKIYVDGIGTEHKLGSPFPSDSKVHNLNLDLAISVHISQSGFISYCKFLTITCFTLRQKQGSVETCLRIKLNIYNAL